MKGPITSKLKKYYKNLYSLPLPKFGILKQKGGGQTNTYKYSKNKLHTIQISV